MLFRIALLTCLSGPLWAVPLAEELCCQAATLVSQHKTTEAIEKYSEAIGVDPGYGKAYIARGVCHSNLGHDQEAVEDYTRGYQLTQNSDYLFNRADSYLRLGKVEQAVADYQTVVQMCQNPELVQYSREVLEDIQKTK